MSDSQVQRPSVIGVVFRLWLGLVVLVGAGMFFKAMKASRHQPEAADASRGLQQIEAFAPFVSSVARSWGWVGTVEAEQAVEVPSRVGSIVVALAEGLNEGVRVEKGQMLCQMDTSAFVRDVDVTTRQIAEMEAALALLDSDAARLEAVLAVQRERAVVAADDLARLQKLAKKQAVTDNDLSRTRDADLMARQAVVDSEQALAALPARRQQAQAALESAQARQAVAQEQLDRCEVTAPVSGRVARLDVQPGQALQPGQSLVRLVPEDGLSLRIQLPASAAGDVQVGQAIDVDGEVLSIDRMAPEADVGTRTLTAWVDLPPDAQARGWIPGRFMQGEVTGHAQPEGVLVPRRSVQGGILGVLVPQENLPMVLEGPGGNYRIKRVEVRELFDVREVGSAAPKGVVSDDWVLLEAGDWLETPGLFVATEAAEAQVDGMRARPLFGAPDPVAEDKETP